MISSRFSTSPKSELTSQRLRYRPPTPQKAITPPHPQKTIALPHPKSELTSQRLRYRPPLSPKSEQLKCNFIFSSNSNQKS